MAAHWRPNDLGKYFLPEECRWLAQALPPPVGGAGLRHGVCRVPAAAGRAGRQAAGAVLDDRDKAWDFGLGAGFYLNATQEPWARHYRMYDYVVQELPALIEANFPVSGKRGISGHSMGGHGALVCALRNPGRYQSLSAFAPISNPSNCPWGEKAFSRYLGDERSRWREWDACALLAEATEKLPILIDRGDCDASLKTHLKPQLLQAQAQAQAHPLWLRLQPGYDHSYYFIASFIDDHLRHHAAALKVE